MIDWSINYYYHKPILTNHIGCIRWRTAMALVKKTIELDQEQINRIKTALKAKSEKEAINTVLGQFDTDLQLAEATLKDMGTFDFREV